MSPTPRQQIVVYDKPGERCVVYDSAYSSEQAVDAMRRCVRAPGIRSNVRVMDPRKRKPVA